MDRIMGGAGLHGRAFIPLLSSFACAIPGIMATRVIDNRRDRLTTILIAPLMTCSARIPVYTLIISAFIPAKQIGGWINLQGLVMFGLYTAGIASALGVSFVVKFFMWRDYQPAQFMLELPDYKVQRLRSIAIGVYTRAKMFLCRAGTTILSMMVLIWFLASFPQPPVGAEGPAINYSLAAMIGHALEPILAPLGFNWQIAVALIPGMAAREVAVAALGTVYAIEGGKEAAGQIGQMLASKWSLATALSLLVWYIFAPQCASTLAVIRRETGSAGWMVMTFTYMLALAWSLEMRLSWMGKHGLFRWPFGGLMRWLGGIPIRRHLQEDVVTQMAAAFGSSNALVLAVPAEATRALVKYWRSGFYHIAMAARVPIVLGFLDYSSKSGGFGPAIEPSGDIKRDMDKIRAFYADKVGKYPEKFGEVRLREETE